MGQLAHTKLEHCSLGESEKGEGAKGKLTSGLVQDDKRRCEGGHIANGKSSSRQQGSTGNSVSIGEACRDKSP